MSNCINNKDNDIWSKFLAGDEDALAIIYNEQYTRLYSYGCKITDDKELVKDCIQDLFLKIYINRSNLRETVNLNTYLIRALKNKLYDKFVTNIEIYSIDAIPFDLTCEEPFFSQFIMNDEDLLQKNKLTKSLKMLSDRQREAIYLKFIQELTYDELSEVLEINYQSAKNLISRTLIKLREVYFGL